MLSIQLGRSILAAVIVTAATAHAHAAPTYTFIELGTFGGSQSQGMAINKAGVVVGVATQPSNGDNPPYEPARPALWSGTTPVDLGTLGGDFGAPSGINNAGQVVGVSSLPNGAGSHATLWSGGTAHDLGTLGGTWSSAFAINKAGIIVGQASRVGTGMRSAVVWKKGAIKALPSLGGTFSSANAISDTGFIAGWSEDSHGTRHAVLWKGTTLTDLGADRGDCYPLGVNNVGQMAGYAPSPSGYAHATLWTNGKAKDLGTLGGDQSIANAIDDDGVVIGTSWTAGNLQSHATMWTKGKVVDLNDRLDQATRDAGWVLLVAVAINGRGQITGVAENTMSGTSHAFLLSR